MAARRQYLRAHRRYAPVQLQVSASKYESRTPTRELVWSYFDPYIDMTGRIKGNGLTSLYDLGNYDWRFNARNMHKIEDHLRAILHKKLRSSDRRYEDWHERYMNYKKRFPDRSPSYYPNRHQWML